jgi:methionine-S-sulfoxide reductase
MISARLHDGFRACADRRRGASILAVDSHAGADVRALTHDIWRKLAMSTHTNVPGSTTARSTEVAVLAGGCFWGVEDILRDVPGVIDTDVGYTGGWLENPTYHDTHDSKSGHAEAVRITFDPTVLSYEDLLEQWFFRLHDPTTLNRQGNDIGTQYRSAIFPQSPEQEVTARRVIERVNASGKWRKPITTSIEPAGTWYSAETYHQDYLRKNPGGYTCHYLRD